MTTPPTRPASSASVGPPGADSSPNSPRRARSKSPCDRPCRERARGAHLPPAGRAEAERRLWKRSFKPRTRGLRTLTVPQERVRWQRSWYSSIPWRRSYPCRPSHSVPSSSRRDWIHSFTWLRTQPSRSSKANSLRLLPSRVLISHGGVLLPWGLLRNPVTWF